MKKKFYPVGKEVIADFFDCRNFTDSSRKIKKVVLESLDVGSLHLVKYDCVRYEVQGLSVCAFLKESSLTIHTYPEWNFLSINCFTCGSEGNVEKAVEYLEEFFKPQKVNKISLNRGYNLSTFQK